MFDSERRFKRRVAPHSIKTFLFHHVEEEGEILNLSEAGAGLLTSTELLKGQKVSVNFFLPQNLECQEAFPIFIIAEVVWQKNANGDMKGLRHKTGIKFDLILPEHREIIRSFINSIPDEKKPTN